LLNRSGYMAIPFMGLYVTQSLHRPKFDAGLISLIFGIGSILGAAAGGKLTDVFGFRPVQIVAALIGGAFFLVFSQVNDFKILCILALFISFFCDAFRPANFTAIAAYATAGTATRSYSLNRLATNIGWSVGVSIGGLIASFNYKLLFIVDGVVNILVAISIFMFLPAIKGFRKAVQQKVRDMVIRKPWQDLPYVKFLLLTTVFATCFFLMFRVVPVFFKEEWHIDEAEIGLILALNGVIIALFEMIIISKIESRRSPVFYIVTGVLVIAFGFGVLMLPKFIPVVLAVTCIICFTFGEMLSMPFMNIFVTKRSNEFNRGQYAAGYSISWSIAQLGPICGFYFAEKLGYSAVWIGITLILIACAYGFSRLNLEENEL